MTAVPPNAPTACADATSGTDRGGHDERGPGARGIGNGRRRSRIGGERRSAVWDRREKQRIAVERGEDSLKGTHAGVPTTAQMPPIRL